MEAERVREMYRELTGVGPHEPKDPALLEWRWEDRLALHLFPVFPGKTATVEYTLTVPTRYRDETYILSYPHANEGDAFVRPVVTVELRRPMESCVWRERAYRQTRRWRSRRGSRRRVGMCRDVSLPPVGT